MIVAEKNYRQTDGQRTHSHHKVHIRPSFIFRDPKNVCIYGLIDCVTNKMSPRYCN